MKTLNEIFEIIEKLDDNTFDEMCKALDSYFEKGGALRLYNVSRKIGLTVDEVWKWENA